MKSFTSALYRISQIEMLNNNNLMITQTAPKIFGGEIQNHALLFVSKKSDDFTKHTEAFKTAAAEFKGQVSYTGCFCCCSYINFLGSNSIKEF